MPRLTKVSIEEVPKSVPRKRKGKVQQEYGKHIKSLKEGEAGKFRVKDDKEGFAIRNRIKRAGAALGIVVKVKKVGDEIYFWKEAKK